MIPKPYVALAIASTMLAREASLDGLIANASWTLGKAWPWIPPMCAAIKARTGEHFQHFSRDELAQIILDEESFDAAWKEPPYPQLAHYCLDAPIRPQPPAWLAELALPQFAGSGELARWLGLSATELDWFADRWRSDRGQPPQLHHYHYRWVPKRSGGQRLIEVPKERLRGMQTAILRELLNRVPPHPAAHGFRRGHSCLTHARLHTGQRVVLRMDLKDFFPSIPASRVQALFAKLGYPEAVAGVLARLCVNRTPAAVLSGLPWAQRQPFRTPHLAQGAPTSPALANLCAFRLDIRFAALAQAVGAVYSRYADDVVFSGGRELERSLDRLHVRVAAIALEEGFQVNTRKTRAMRAGVRQQITGVVVNRHSNLARPEYDRIKAELRNCVRHGPGSQNRAGKADYRAHLTGLVAHVTAINAQRGAKLRRLLDEVVWSNREG